MVKTGRTFCGFLKINFNVHSELGLNLERDRSVCSAPANNKYHFHQILTDKGQESCRMVRTCVGRIKNHAGKVRTHVVMD